MFHQQIDTVVIDAESLPWMPFAPFSDEILIKYIKADPIRGEVINMLKAPPGSELPMHHHSGTVIVYTIQGSWKYKEHDWVAGPGSIVYETAASRHTPEVVNTSGDLIVLNIILGDLVFLGENDQVLAIENWKTSVGRYEAFCKRENIEMLDLTAFG